MVAEATSRNLRTTTELTVVAKLKQEFVRVSEPLSYTTRVERLLTALFDRRKEGIETGGDTYVGPLERLQTIRSVSWNVLREHGVLVLHVIFDRAWEPYIRSIVDDAGPLLDVIFCHCEGYEGHTTKDGYDRFARWVRDHQSHASFFYASTPELTVDDVSVLRNLKVTRGELRREVAKADSLRPPPPSAGSGDSSTVATQPLAESDEQLAAALGDQQLPPSAAQTNMGRFLGTLVGLFRLRKSFPNVSNAFDKKAETDAKLFARASRELLRGNIDEGLWSKLQYAKERQDWVPKPLRAAYPDLLPWLNEVTETDKPDMQKADSRHHDFSQVQAHIRSGYDGMTHGALVLVRITLPRDFLEYLTANVTTESGEKSELKLNVAFTYKGLERLGVDPLMLASLPAEFREGMEKRAGLTGDIGSSHPLRWVLPQSPIEKGNESVKQNASSEIQLSTVDAAVLLQTAGNGEDENASWHGKHPLHKSVSGLSGKGVKILHIQPLRRFSKNVGKYREKAKYREHFGFIDGISQPVPTPNHQPQPSKSEQENYDNKVATGEILLGHADDRGVDPMRAILEAYKEKLRETEDPNDETLTEHDWRSQFLANGSFLVVRKLRQDVKAFNEVTKLGSEMDVKLMGRAKNGGWPHKSLKDQSNYDSDPHGVECPLQSHVRRANPRTDVRYSVHGEPVTVPRILRRGFSYGTPYDIAEKEEDADRGLLFMAYNARIAQQFEVIQRWLNGGNVTGLPSSQNDPICGAREILPMSESDQSNLGKTKDVLFSYEAAKDDEPDTATSQTPQAKVEPTKDSEKKTVTKFVTIDKPLVTLEWGAYFFAPSKTSLEWLHKNASTLPSKEGQFSRRGQQDSIKRTEDVAEVERGQRLLQSLPRLPELNPGDDSPEVRAAIFKWKELLEGEGRREDARAAWACIRAEHNGVLKCPLGVLVGGKEPMLKVLCDNKGFSVSEYGTRMQKSIGMLHLGLDKQADQNPGNLSYESEASIVNQYVGSIGRVRSFIIAVAVMDTALQTMSNANPGSRCRVDLWALGERVVGAISQLWFGLPDGPAFPSPGRGTRSADSQSHMKIGGGEANSKQPHCPIDFIYASRYIFRGVPDDWAETLACDRGKKIENATQQYVVNTKKPSEGTLLKKLREGTKEDGLSGEKATEKIVRGMVGAVDGFVAANFGSFASVMNEWLESEKLWQVQQDQASTLETLKSTLRTINKTPTGATLGDSVSKLKAVDAKLSQVEAALAASAEGESLGNENEQIVRAIGALSEHLKENSPLNQSVTSALNLLPVPNWLNRRAKKEQELSSEVRVKKGDLVILNPGSASLEAGGEAMLFGGDYNPVKKQQSPDNTPLHACPAREMGMGVLMGMLTAVLWRQNLRRESKLLVSFK